MANILVTGGGGFIGSHVAEFYAKNKKVNTIYIIDNLSRAKLLKKANNNFRYNWDYLKQYDNILFFKRDIKNYNFLKSFFKKNPIDIVIHTAAQTAVTTSIIDPLTDFENNMIGTFSLLEAIRRSKLNPTIIFCSTNKVFGNNVNNLKVIESDSRYQFLEENALGIFESFPIDLCEHTPYGASKLCSDIYFQEYAHTYGLKSAVFRMSCIYGTRQFGVEDQGWVAHLIISALTGKKINIFGDGKQVRDILYISDLINVFDAFIKKADKIKHDVFCIGGGADNTLSLLELIEILEELSKNNIKYEFFNWRPSDQRIFVSDISKAKKQLEWTPKVNPHDGVKKIVDWIKINIDLFT
ncbi:MAG: GDP-mannose 4,6-dehydratase [Promethearchaeota archaeon]